MASQYHQQTPRLPANPTTLTTQRGRKRSADLEDLRQPNVPENHPPRRILAMITSIPQSIWNCSVDVFGRFVALFRREEPVALQQNPDVLPTHIDAVPTDYSGRKRRAVDATPRNSSQHLRPREQDHDMMLDAPPHRNSLPTSFRKPLLSPKKKPARPTVQRNKWYKSYFVEGQSEGPRCNQGEFLIYPPDSPIKSKSKRSPLRDIQINGLISKAHRAQGGSFAQKAAQKAAEEKAAREAAEREAAEKLAAEQAAQEAARIEEELEYQRLLAEAEAAARAQEIIVDLPELVRDDLFNQVIRAESDREEIARVGPFPIQKLSIDRIISTADGTKSWLDDDAVNAWYHAILEAKNRQTGYVKKEGNVPAFSMLNTGWWAKASSKEGPSSLKRWTKRAGIGGANLLKCERLFLPINTGAHWTLLIINGTDRSFEYLDSLGGDGKRVFAIARELVKSELGDLYRANEWTELKRNRSSMQSNMSDCGVFACFNGLAAAKERPYKEIVAKKMPQARSMLAGILVNGGFEGEFDL